MPKKGYKPDKLLWISTLALVAVGIVMVYSAGLGRAFVGQVRSPFVDLTNQLVALLLGAAAGFFAYKIRASALRAWSYPIYFLSLFLLMILLIPGVGITINYSTRWIEIAGFSFQPSEFAKVGVILATAAFLSDREPKKLKLSEILLLEFMIAVPAMIVLRSPDLGSASVILLIFVSQYFLANAPFIGLIILAGFFALGIFLQSITSTGYWRQRIASWLSPFEFSDSLSYQMVQALIAVTNGGLFGMGLFSGQQKFGRLPMVESDFIYSLILEELGFVGGIIVALLFLLFVVRAFAVANRCKSRFLYLVAVGIAIHIGFQAFINMSVATGLFPVTGVTLPFISKGGTSLIVNLIEVGILFGIDRQNREEMS